MNALVSVGAVDRRTYIGGSAIASILGLQPSRWRSAVQLYQRMTADAPEEETAKAQRKLFARGHIVEPLVARMLADLYGIDAADIKSVSNQRFVDPDVPYFAAEIDFELPLSAVRQYFPEDCAALPDDYIVNVEIKTVSPFAASEWGEEGSEDIPVHYAAQIYWGLGVTRRQLALCAALFGADDLVLYPIVADADTIDGMRRMAAEFWQRVQDRDPPPPQSIADTLRLWPIANDARVEASEEIIAALSTFKLMNRKSKTYDDGKDGVSLLIREFMKDASALTLDGIEIATLRQQKTSSIDADRLKSEFPDAFKACHRIGTTRVFRPKGD